MDQQEYDRLREEIEREYRARLAALDVVFKIASPQADINSSRGEILGLVKDAISQFGETAFTWIGVEAKLKELHPGREFCRSSIRQAVRNLAFQKQKLSVIRQGIGRRPTLYKSGNIWISARSAASPIAS